ncbi:MAG: TolC family protein [Proteobacteria bacterium]|nr:TolC family protein [Pseudomonadota bacterium]
MRAIFLSLLGAFCSLALAAPAQELVAVDLRGETLRLEVNSGLEGVRRSRLPDPPRLVLDLYGIQRLAAELPEVPASGPIAGVRVGRHPDKLRVVVDLKQPLESYRVRRTDRVVEIDLSSAMQSEAAKAASAPVPEPRPATEPVPAADPPLPAAAGPAPTEAPDETAESPAPEPGTDPEEPEGTRLSLRQAVQAALINNIELEIARADPRIAEEQLAQASGAYDPEIFLDHTFEQRENPTYSVIQDQFTGESLTRIEEDEWRYSGGFGGVLPLGLSYSSSYQVRRLESASAFSSLDPEWRGDWVSQLRLPLLRDLFHNSASVTVRRRGIARDISLEEFRRQLVDLIVSVEASYWELSAARSSLDAARKSLQTAGDLLDQTRIQYEVGVVSRVEVTQAEAGLAQREVDAIVAQNRALAAQDALLNLIYMPSMDQYTQAHLLIDNPSFVDYEVDPNNALSKALESRPELEAARKRIEDAEVQLGFAKNQRLPRLDLTGSYTHSGLAGKPKPSAFNPDPIALFPIDSGGIDDEFLHAGGDRSWGIGARIEVPLGNVTARHRVTERQIELRRARSRLKRREQDVILDVRAATRQIRSSSDAVRAARRREAAAEENLRAEQERLRLGDSTPFLVLEFEEDVAEAQQQVIVSLQTYRNAITQLERAQGTLLPTLGIGIEDELNRPASTLY